MSVHVLYSEDGHLLTGKSKLVHPLTSSIELLGQPSVHLRLFTKTVLGVLLLAEKLGLLTQDMKCPTAALSNSHPVSIHFSAWLFFTIANIANCDPLHPKARG
jgi:hypothetical protein